MAEQLRSIRSRAAILDAAADLIRARGVAMTSMADIIAASGVSAGAIYHHYPSKNAILEAVARRAVEWPLATLAAFRDDPPSPAQFFALALEATAQHPERVQLLGQFGAGAATDGELGEGLRGAFSDLRNGAQGVMDAWAARNGLPPDAAAGLGQLLIGLVWGYLAQTLLVADVDRASYLERGSRLLEALVPVTEQRP